MTLQQLRQVLTIAESNSMSARGGGGAWNHGIHEK